MCQILVKKIIGEIIKELMRMIIRNNRDLLLGVTSKIRSSLNKHQNHGSLIKILNKIIRPQILMRMLSHKFMINKLIMLSLNSSKIVGVTKQVNLLLQNHGSKMKIVNLYKIMLKVIGIKNQCRVLSNNKIVILSRNNSKIKIVGIKKVI